MRFNIGILNEWQYLREDTDTSEIHQPVFDVTNHLVVGIHCLTTKGFSCFHDNIKTATKNSGYSHSCTVECLSVGPGVVDVGLILGNGVSSIAAFATDNVADTAYELDNTCLESHGMVLLIDLFLGGKNLIFWRG